MPQLLPLDCENFHDIIQNPFKHSRGHNFDSDCINLGHNIYFCKHSVMFCHEGSKYRSPGQILQNILALLLCIISGLYLTYHTRFLHETSWVYRYQ